MEVYQKEHFVPHVRDYNNPKKFHEAIQDFFNGINKNYKNDLKSLLTLRFQFFDNKKSLIYPLWSIKDALIRKFGKEFYAALSATAEHQNKKKYKLTV